MSHLQEEAYDGWWLTVHHTDGDIIYPLHDGLTLSPVKVAIACSELHTEHENATAYPALGTIEGMVIGHGWRARLSGPGYFAIASVSSVKVGENSTDCTKWSAIYRTEDEALASLDEDYGTKCCYCGERVGACNADAPCDGCEEDVSWEDGGLSCMGTGEVVIVDQLWTTRWADKWPCSTLSGKWVTLYQDDEKLRFDDCEGGRESIDSHEAQAMADDVHDIVREHYEEVSA